MWNLSYVSKKITPLLPEINADIFKSLLIIFMTGQFAALQEKGKEQGGKNNIFSSLSISQAWTVDEKLESFLVTDTSQCMSDQKEK